MTSTSMPHGTGTDVEGTMVEMGRVVHACYLSPFRDCSTSFYWVAEKRGQADGLDFGVLRDDSTRPFFERVTDSP